MGKFSVQSDLFPASGSSDIKSGLKSRSFFSFFFGYEKVIIISIGFLVCAVISFSFGVEHGRRIVGYREHLNIESAAVKPVADVALKAKAVPVGPVLSAQTVNSVPQEKVIAKLPVIGVLAKQNNNGRYTIQVAAYKNSGNAQREAEILKKIGLEVKVLVKGEYSVLYAGSFSDKQKAQIVLGELEKKYKGCIIRRL